MAWIILFILVSLGLFYGGKMSVQSEIDNLKESLGSYMEKCENLYKEISVHRLNNERLLNIIKSKSPFMDVSNMLADIETKIYDKSISALKNKERPAFKAAEEIKIFRDKSRECMVQYKEMQYKYEFLLRSFPELSKYVDDYQSLLAISKCVNYADFKENEDRAFEYLSIIEWSKLSPDERNQLALDRYKTREKSSWTIGVEYEMYIDYLFRTAGFKTINTGVKDGLNDLGRDIIAIKDGIHYIIQCKNWSSKKEIHENVICQLFGTTLEYKIQKSSNNNMNEWDKKVVPVLYTTTALSDTAKKFADKLGVKVYVKEKKEYPMIKCNIGRNKEKIYHLPFDQQYYKVNIDELKGEFYAWTIKEAVDKGFRRAYRHNPQK